MTKNKYLRLFYGLVVVVVIVSAILIAITPKEQLEPPTIAPAITTTNIDKTVSNFNEVSFVGNDQLVLDYIANNPTPNIYRIVIAPNGVDEVAKLIINNLELQLTFSNQTISFYQNDSYELMVNSVAKSVVLNKKITPDPQDSLTGFIDAEQAILVAKHYLNQVINLPLEPRKNAVAYFAGEPHMEPTTSLTAKFISVPFTIMLEELPVFFEQEQQDIAQVLLNSSNEIVKVEITPINLSFDPAKQARLMGVYEAIDNINQKKIGSIIMVEQEGMAPVDLSTIQSGELSEVGLEYRVDMEQGIAYPAYRFLGKLTNGEGVVFKAILITPAISIQGI